MAVALASSAVARGGSGARRACLDATSPSVMLRAEGANGADGDGYAVLIDASA